MRHLLHINGLDGPLLKQFGCACGRCLAPERQANTSASLISLDDDGNTVHHLLFDIGLGVVDSLNATPHLAGPRARLDGIALTHWHPDHVAELNRLVVAYYFERRRRGLEAPRVPLYCRSGTADWLRREQGYLLDVYLEPHLSGEYEPPGTRLAALPVPLPGVRITPVAVSHFTADQPPDGRREAAYATTAFVIETERRKAVLLWDIDSENEWLAEPQTAAQEEAVACLADADLLAIDTTFWRRKAHRTTHPAFDNVRRYARTLRPRETLLVHMSGHPDGPGNPGWGWTNAEWTAAASVAWQADGLPGTVRVPDIGDVIEL